ncbi:Ig-like domain-containing protein [Leifsonia sp. RAF41]|uniref:Ig-like domain-containing protein n=1 Tax=Leifsonia sp. RAF41 TaxID=3233056 RepID=UPI003F979ED9
MSLALGFSLVPLAAADAAGPAVVSVVTTITDTAGTPVTSVNAATIPNGRYVLNIAYSCNIADCLGTNVTIPGPAVDSFYGTQRRELNTYIFNPPFSPPPPITGTAYNGLTVNLGTVTAGTSGSFGIEYTVFNNTPSGVAGGSFFLNGSQIQRSATISATNSDTPATSTATATWVSTVPSPSAALSAPANTATDTDVTVFWFRSTSGCVQFDASLLDFRAAAQFTCAQSYTATVQLPPKAVYVPGSGGTYDAGTHSVTFAQSGQVAARGVYGQPGTFRVQFPSTQYPTTSPGCIVTETFSGTQTVTYLDGQVKAASTTQNLQVGNCAPFGKANIGKGMWNPAINAFVGSVNIPNTPGGTAGVRWQVTANNQGNVPGVATISDTTLDLPDLAVTNVGYSGTGGSLSYTLDDGTTGTAVGSITAPAGRRIVAATATSAPLVGPNSDPSGALGTPFTVVYNTVVRYGATPGQRCNTASGSVAYPGSPGLNPVSVGPVTSCVTLVSTAGQIGLSAGAPAATVTGGGTAVVGSEVIWRANGSISNLIAGSPLRPQYVYIAPLGWTIPANGASFTATPPAGATFDYRTVTFNGTVRQAVVVNWPAPLGVDGTATLPQLQVKTSPTLAAPAGTNNQTATFMLGDVGNSIATSYSPVKYVDTTDVDGDGSSTDAFASANGVTSLSPTRSVGVKKEICRPDSSAADGCDWIADPDIRVGVPPAAAAIKYRVTLQNLGNADLTNVVIYDVLPYVGDVGTSDATATTPRGSTVTETLVGVSDVGAGVTLAYSTSTNPPRPQVYSGATTGTWTGTAGGASSIRATLTTLPFQASRSFVYSAALVGGAADQVACNSVAAATDLLASIEPRPVCATTEESDLLITAGAHYPLQTNRVGTIPFVVTNLGGSTAAPATATIDVPAGVEIAGLAQPGWLCTAPGTTGPTEISCRAVNPDGTTSRLLPINTPETISPTFRPSPSAASTVCFTGTVHGIYNDPFPANDVATSCATVAPSPPQLRVTKTDGVTSVAVGQQTTYTIAATNLLVAESVSGITLVDTLPPGVAYVSSTPTAAVNGSTLTWTGALAAAGVLGDGTSTSGGAGSSFAVAVTVQVLPGAQDSIVNSVVMTAPDPADAATTFTDQATDTDTVLNVFTPLNPAVTTPQNTPVTTPLAQVVTAAGAALDPAAVSQQTAPQHGSLSINGTTGAITYTPAAGYSGPDTYEVQFCDTSSPAQCGTGPVSVTVQPNTVTAVDDSATTTAGTAVSTDVRANDISASGQPLWTPAVATQPAHGAAAVDAFGNIVYTPNAQFSGDDSYTYTVCDTSTPTPACGTGTVAVLVNNVFVDGPAADSNGGIGTAQNTPVTTPLADIVTALGAPLDPTTVTQITAPRHGSITIDPVTGAVTYAPASGYGGTDTYDVNVCDTAAPQECHSVVVGVTIPPNEVTAGDDTATVNAGSSVTTDVLANDTSESAQPLADPTIATPPAHGAAVVNANGTITYTPDSGYSGTDSYVYEICDTSNPIPSCDSATVLITIDNVFIDGPAAAGNAGVVTGQNTPVVTPLADIVTTLGMPISPAKATVAAPPGHGTLALNATTGAITYTPAAGYAGPDTYGVTECDTAIPQQCHSVTVAVTVTGNVVTAGDDTATTAAGSPVTTNVRANDLSATGEPLADPSVTVQPADGTTTITASGDITYNPNAGFSGSDSYTYTVCDMSAPTPACDSATVDVTVTNVFVDGPAASSNGGVSTPQNTAVTTPLADIAHTLGAPLDPTSVSQAIPPAHGIIAIDPTTGAVTYSPTAGYSGEDAYTVSVCDTATPQECDTVMVGVTVAVNVVTAVDDTATTNAGVAVSTDVRSNDTSLSGQPLAAPTVTAQPDNGSATVAGNGDITFTPAAGWSGRTVYSYEVCDTSTPTPVCDSADVAVTVDNVFTDGPAAQANSGIVTTQNQPVTTPLADIMSASGSPVDPATVTQETAPAFGSVDIDPLSGAVTYTPSAGYAGADSYAVSACDTATPQECHTTVVGVTVQPNTVTAVDDSATVNAGSSVTTAVGANDTSSSGQQFALPTISTQPANGTTAVNADGSITYTPDVGFSGTDSYAYTICDTSFPDPVCATASVAVTIDNVFIDGPAAAGNLGVETPQDTAVTTPLQDIVTTTGKPIDPSTVTAVTAPQHGAISIDPATGAVTYTPGAGYTGTDGYEIRVCDTATPPACDSVEVAVTVLANTVSAPDLQLTTRTDQVAAPLDVLAVSVSGSGQPLAAPPTVTAQPTHGTVTVNSDNTLTYAPDAGFDGADAFTYQVCDTSTPAPACDTGVVAVTVTPVADLALTKSLDLPGAVASLPIAYTIATSNHGPSAAANVRTIDPIPAAILHPQGTPDPAVPGADCETRTTRAADLALLDPDYGPYTLTSHPSVVECAYPTVAAGATVTDRITGTVDPGLAAGTVLRNEAVVLTTAYDPALDNNRAAATADSIVLPPALTDILTGLAGTGSNLRAWSAIALSALLLTGTGAVLLFVRGRRRRAGTL